MGPYELRPLSLGELLDRAFTLYRKNFWLFAGIMLFPACLILPARFLYLRSYGIPNPWARPAPHPGSQAFTYSLLFVSWLAYSVAQAATTYAVADAYLGRAAGVRHAYGKIRGRLWRIIGVTLNVGFRVFGLMFLLVFGAAVAGGVLAAAISHDRIPGTAAILMIVAFVLFAFALAIAFSLRYALCLPAMLIEEMRAGASIRRSVQLSQGRRGQIFLAIFLGLLLVYAIGALFQGPFYAGAMLAGIKGKLPISLALGMSISGAIGGTIGGPLLMIVLVLYYYDLRIRKEAFDLQQMMTSLPGASPGEVAKPPEPWRLTI